MIRFSRYLVESLEVVWLEEDAAEMFGETNSVQNRLATVEAHDSELFPVDGLPVECLGMAGLGGAALVGLLPAADVRRDFVEEDPDVVASRHAAWTSAQKSPSSLDVQALVEEGAVEGSLEASIVEGPGGMLRRLVHLQRSHWLGEGLAQLLRRHFGQPVVDLESAQLGFAKGKM